MKCLALRFFFCFFFSALDLCPCLFHSLSISFSMIFSWFYVNSYEMLLTLDGWKGKICSKCEGFIQFCFSVILFFFFLLLLIRYRRRSRRKKVERKTPFSVTWIYHHRDACTHFNWQPTTKNFTYTQKKRVEKKKVVNKH